MKSVVWQLALWLCLFGSSAGVWAATTLATATIVDGETLLIRDALRLQLSEGVRLTDGDIIETTAKARFARIEFTDGVILDLGPESSMLMAPRLSGDRSRRDSRFHLLRGVAKLTVPKPLASTAGMFTSPAFDVKAVARSAVLVVQAEEAFAFAESGNLTLRERQGSRAGASITVKSGEFYARTGDTKSKVGGRPTQAFIQRLPRAFLDTLPSRASLFKARDVPPKPLGEFGFSDAEAWINADGLRSHFASRWRGLARDSAFRQGVAADLRSHPEWGRILYPPKPPASSPASSPAAAYGNKP